VGRAGAFLSMHALAHSRGTLGTSFNISISFLLAIKLASEQAIKLASYQAGKLSS